MQELGSSQRSPMVFSAEAAREFFGRNPRDARAVLERLGNAAPFDCVICEHSTPGRVKPVVNESPMHENDVRFFARFAA